MGISQNLVYGAADLNPWAGVGRWYFAGAVDDSESGKVVTYHHRDRLFTRFMKSLPMCEKAFSTSRFPHVNGIDNGVKDLC